MKIGSVKAEILLTLSFSVVLVLVVVGGLKSFSRQTKHRLCEVELRLSWDFDNKFLMTFIATNTQIYTP